MGDRSQGAIRKRSGESSFSSRAFEYPKTFIPKTEVTDELPDDVSEFCLELMSLQDEDLVPNPQAFDCPICFATIDALKGVILKNCLHTFCKECLNSAVKYNDKAEVVCPYKDDIYSCDCILQDQEIRGVATPEVREEHIWRSLELAEMTAEGSFHCKTPYCFGWWFVVGDLDELVQTCPVCRVLHCITCNTIHNGMTCNEFKDQKLDDEDPLTKVIIDSMADKPNSLKCPGCKILIEREYGCDYLVCKMCKTGICFVTGLKRWGPDGCRCKENKKKCHPNCNNCH